MMMAQTEVKQDGKEGSGWSQYTFKKQNGQNHDNMLLLIFSKEPQTHPIKHCSQSPPIMEKRKISDFSERDLRVPIILNVELV